MGHERCQIEDMIHHSIFAVAYMLTGAVAAQVMCDDTVVARKLPRDPIPAAFLVASTMHKKK